MSCRFLAVVCLHVVISATAPSTDAATMPGSTPIDLVGNLQSQNLVRHPNAREYQLIQQRNTLRVGLQSTTAGEQAVAWLTTDILTRPRLTLLYRAAYDSVYDYTPTFRERDLRGRKPSRLAARDLDDLPRRALDAIKLEHELRAAYVDAALHGLPIRLRVGKQQIVWGEADFFRMLDRANPLDLSWHGAQELPPPAFGWDELRIPLWFVRAWSTIGDVGPLTDLEVEGYWNVGDWRPIKVSFLPRPWGVRLLDPLTNREDGALHTFGEMHRLAYGTRLFEQGRYRRTPIDNSQFGVKGSAAWRNGLRFGLYYLYQRWAGDDGTPVAPVRGLPDDDVGRSLTQELIARRTLPVEYVVPYVHTVGLSANYFDPRWTQATYRLETVFDFGLPLFDRRRETTLSPLLPGVNERDYWKAMLALDHAVSLSWLNGGNAVFVTAQWFVHHLLGGTGFLTGPLDLPTTGRRPRAFCGAPPGIPCTDPSGNGSFRDDVHSWESLITLAALTFVGDGSIVPVAGMVVDPVNSYGMNVFWSVDWAASSTLSFNLTQRFFVSAQDDLQKGPFDPWQIGTQRGRSETGFRVTYAF
jgi:hypothetical protein